MTARANTRESSLRWLCALVVGLALALGTAPARADPFAYVTNSGSDNASQYNAASGGLLAPLVPPTVVAGDLPRDVVVRPDGHNAYVTNQGTDDVSQYVVRGGALSPSPTSRIAAGDSPVGIAITPDSRRVYVANQGSDDVSQYDSGADGALRPNFFEARVAAGDVPTEVVISRDGHSAYVTNQFSDDVSQYDVGADGVLSPKIPATVAAGDAPFGIAMSPSGANLYVTNLSGGVSQYDVGAGGALSPKTPATVPGGNVGVAVSPDGESVYATDSRTDDIHQYDLRSNGALSPKTPATVAAGHDPIGVAVSSNGESVYVANQGAGDIFQYDVGAGGLLSPKSPASVPAGAGPFGVAVSPPPNHQPSCTTVGAVPNTILPATREFVAITLAGASDPDGDPLSFQIDRVTQDERVSGPRIGDSTFPDARFTAAGRDSNRVEVRAERNPHGDGRIYRIAFTVVDTHLLGCSGAATVSVPRRRGEAAVDSSPPSFDSFTGTAR